MQIDLQVKKGGNGRLTLTQRTQLEMMPSDIQEPFLFGNEDHASFYRAVALKLDALHQAGHNVLYKDVSY